MNLRSMANLLEVQEQVRFQARGHSMEPKVRDKDWVVVVRHKGTNDLRKGDIVLCRVHGRYLLHQVLQRGWQGVKIGNNKGGENGWTRQVFGRLHRVEGPKR